MGAQRPIRSELFRQVVRDGSLPAAIVMTLMLSAIVSLAQQGTQVADSLRTDSIAVESPLPSPALGVVRFLFNTVPQWVQIGGVFLGAAVALVVLFLAWRHRVAVGNWFTAKSRAWKMGFAAIALVVLGGIGFAGSWSWNYMMHDNEFCGGCHIMNVPFERFGTSEHAKLQCHDCHRQSIFASMKELYVQVTERPDKIPEHRSVPNAICSECHIQRDADSTWKRVSATAGHQVHLNPRSPVMSRIECTTCHGQEVHRFKPVSETCAQSGCHDDVKVELGKMAQQTDLHCTVCHEFTVKAVEGNPIDSSRAALVPGDQQCLGCHAMQERMGEFAPEKEPHGAKCGTCHNPHAQTTPTGAFQSCATSGCHVRSDSLTASHRNLGRHRLETCGACHGAHTWTASGVDCRSCHTGIRDPAVRTRPPGDASPMTSTTRSPVGGPSPHGTRPAMPAGRPSLTPVGGDGRDIVQPPPAVRGTRAVLRPTAWSGSRQAGAVQSPPPAGRARWRGHEGPQLLLTAVGSSSPQGRDTAKFQHARHESVSCTTCHRMPAGSGDLKRLARDCQGCHHASTAVGRDCVRCHTAAEMGAARTVQVPFALAVWPQPRTRPLGFSHGQHGRLECSGCHADARVKAVGRTCASCHGDHHTEASTCSSCHPPARETHQRDVHATGCATSGCHERERGTAVSPVRATCLACHAEQKEHMPKRECAPCHLSAWTGPPGGARP